MTQKPRTPIRQRIDALLADGRWHVRRAVVAEAMHAVPPGRARRHALNRRSRRRPPGAPERPAARCPGLDVSVGAGDIVRRLIADAVRTGAYEQRRTNGGVPEVRLAVEGGPR